MTEEEINKLIKDSEIDTNRISDGYHTFGELYEHRIALYIALCNALPEHFWKARKHHDGTEMDGWFISGSYSPPGKQISYHLPVKMWKYLDIKSFDIAPITFDGHTSSDVIERILNLGSE